jgi:gluconolactonase
MTLSSIRPIGSAPAAGAPFEAHSDEFAAVTGRSPRLEMVLPTDAHEGPVYVSEEDALYFTSLPRPGHTPSGAPEVVIKRLALDGERFPLEQERVSIVRSASNAANGMTLDHDGRLLICEQGTMARHAAITRLDRRTGFGETVVDEWRGLRFNSPNDVVVRSDGSIWFTDPSYGYLQGFKGDPQIGDFVYRYDPRSDQLTVVADCLDKPNGLAFSPDEGVLYIADSGANQTAGSYDVQRPHHIVAFDVVNECRLAGRRLFAVITPGLPDGIKVDSAGRLYSSSFSGIQVFDPTGNLIGEIHLPGAVNFTFGGTQGNVLFITTNDAIWAAVLDARSRERQVSTTQGSSGRRKR